jgi:hypothetical protein
MTLDTFILSYLRSHGAVLPDELRDAAAAAGHDTCGHYELASGRQTVIPFISQAFAEALLRLRDGRQLRLCATSQSDYLAFNPWRAIGVNLCPVRLEAV